MRVIIFILVLLFSVGCTGGGSIATDTVDTSTVTADTSRAQTAHDETSHAQQQPVQQKMAVLVVPGLFGSFSTHFLGNKERYVRAAEKALEIVDKRFPGTLCGTTIPRTWTVDPLRCTYDPLITALENAGHIVWTFPYDWRDTPDALVPYLDAQVRALAEQTDSGTIAIVAHSYGGLVVRACMQKGLCAQVAKAIFVGTPHRGAVEAYYLYGGDVMGTRGERALKETLLGVMKWAQINQDVSAFLDGVSTNGPALFDYQYVQEYVPSVGKLTPTFDYIRRWHPLKKIAEPVAYEDLCRHNTWLEDLNANAGALFANGATVLNITGTGTKTPQEILVRDLGIVPCKARTRWPNGDPRSVVLANAPQRVWYANGDGVVIADSASFPVASRFVTYRNSAGVDHRALIMDDDVHAAIINFVRAK